jgi:hypothetical protein
MTTENEVAAEAAVGPMTPDELNEALEQMRSDGMNVVDAPILSAGNDDTAAFAVKAYENLSAEFLGESWEPNDVVNLLSQGVGQIASIVASAIEAHEAGDDAGATALVKEVETHLFTMSAVSLLAVDGFRYLRNAA